MRNLSLAVLVSLVAIPLAAQLHEATPLDVLMDRVHMMTMPAYTDTPAALPLPEAATKVFNLNAHRFAYTVNPSPFVVNQGDTVTLNITATDTTHGWFLETYDENGAFIAQGTTHTIQFVATTAGTFTYFCTFFCGDGHPSMNGTFTVNAVENTAPTITSVSPATGSTAGGTTITIKGTNFATGATEKIGKLDALNVNVVDATTITAKTPLGPTSELAGQPLDVTVTNADGQSATKTQAFSYVVPAPSITTMA
ncbi:MAG: IPT/TIG domain-containing protein, partial [Thermoanaerobaculia bacterium]